MLTRKELHHGDHEQGSILAVEFYNGFKILFLGEEQAVFHTLDSYRISYETTETHTVR